MRDVALLFIGLTFASVAFPARLQAGIRADQFQQRSMTESEFLLKMIQSKPPRMACADAGARCSKDSDCCPGSFCAGADSGAPVCVKI